MDAIIGIVVKAFAFLIAMSFIFILFRAGRYLNKYLSKITVFVIAYAGIALIVFFAGYKYFAIFSFILVSGLHILIFYIIVFVKDRKRFRAIQPDDFFAYSNFLIDKSVLFFKPNATEKVKELLGERLRFLEVVRIARKSVFCAFAIHLIQKYRTNNLQAVPIVMSVNVAMHDYNHEIEKNSRRDYVQYVADQNQLISNLEREIEAGDSTKREDISTQLQKLYVNLDYGNAVLLCRDTVSTVSIFDPVVRSASALCADYLKAWVLRIIPEFCMNLIIDAEADALYSDNNTIRDGLEVLISPIPDENPVILYTPNKYQTLKEAAENSRAILVNPVNRIKVDLEFHFDRSSVE